MVAGKTRKRGKGFFITKIGATDWKKTLAFNHQSPLMLKELYHFEELTID